ncbi:hypothetical protein IE81DRAFT_319661 [Ceraceosorus guamensis]|uniref:Nucleotide-sugar transporter n=1 Tax=Ceraceosorus guamensis TaxID=1522189 RepID=A0A316WEL8_9BASI|nr:hypothetical protein IE81DRAFT_319661 [Ceraceosorus guamensis]PWN45825.1 hypothetical protein IE81DRAFT_319661 [Ceraceosorus guamensis]
MAPSTIPLLVGGMLATGISNSIFSKYQDMQCVEHCAPGDDHPRVDFSQPVWQTSQMFLGECLCLLPPLFMALYAWVQSKREAPLFKGGQGTSAYEPLSDDPYAVNALLDDPQSDDSAFNAYAGASGINRGAEAGSSAFSFLMPSHWLGEQGSSSAFSRLVPAFWPVWKAPPKPASALHCGTASLPGIGASYVPRRSAPMHRPSPLGQPPTGSNNAWDERIPANASAEATGLEDVAEGDVEADLEEAEADADADADDADNGALKGRAIFLFVLPAACDICGTTLMNVGLLFTPVSIYQMTRGALVLWVGVFSVIFLQRHLFLFQWLSLLTVMLGVCIVGISGTLLSPGGSGGIESLYSNMVGATHAGAGAVRRSFENTIARRSVLAASRGSEAEGAGAGHSEETLQAFLGVLLILFAQLFTAGQFVLEEKIMGRYSVEPLLAVGYEGLFGFTMTLSAQVLLHYFYGRTPRGQGGYFDMVTGWQQMISNNAVLWSSLAICLSIALFNFFGLSVTRSVSATARSTIDTCRTLGIWAVSLVLGWEVFRPLSGSLQLLGFALLCAATLLFNGVISVRFLPRWLRPSRGPAMARLRDASRSRSQSRASAATAAAADSRDLRRSATQNNAAVAVASAASESAEENAPRGRQAT